MPHKNALLGKIHVASNQVVTANAAKLRDWESTFLPRPHGSPSSLHAPFFIPLDGVLGLGASAAAVCAVRVARELHHVRLVQSENVLESPADRLQDILALRRCAGVLIAWDALAHSACPQAHTVEALAHVHHNTHDFVVIVGLECLADGGELCVQPEVVDRDGALVLELVRPLAAVLVLRVLPLRSYALLEEVVVGLEAQFGGGRDVVLDGRCVSLADAIGGEVEYRT